MSNFYYTILKHIQDENPLQDRIAYYTSQFFLIFLSIILMRLSVDSFSYPSSENSFNLLMYMIIAFICFKIYNCKKLKQAKLLANIAENIKNKYNLNDLTLLKNEVENNLNKINEILKWISLILASVATLIIGQTVNFYLKSFEFLGKEAKEELAQELFKTDFFVIINSFLVPLTLLITGYILFIFLFAQLFNHNKRLTLLVLRNCDYSL